ncbi:hypothetical protein [Streptomyces sp. SID13031]|uniref:hypothetical protein n=1 Tax=Streptomyces sp. SID13031 TaxID=2706046 RepID=UPI0013C7B303|nr:hypothetical protein [Streptomyces sp. SID13031]NEA31727.1 hypothetical protein [Streptomyces sp. SID13031]
MLRKTISLAGAAVLAVALGSTVAPASAEVSATAAAPCSLDLGSVTTAGAQTTRTITATSPATVGAVKTTPGVYQPGKVEHITTFTSIPSGTGASRTGKAVIGGVLYTTSYGVLANGQVDPAHPVVQTRVGGGWTKHRWIEQSLYMSPDPLEPKRSSLYAQDTTGLLARWTLDGTTWRNTGGIGGLTVAKSMTLISRDYYQDTFVLNTRAGKLMTVAVPNVFPMQTYGTTLRNSTWQVFEQLIATRCGPDGSLILGIDRDTNSAYLYQLNHVAYPGTSTVIKSLGKVPGTFTDPHYFRYAPKYDPLNGQ